MKLEVGKWYWVRTGYQDEVARTRCNAITKLGMVGRRYGREPAEQFKEDSVLAEVESADIPDERPWYRRLFG